MKQFEGQTAQQLGIFKLVIASGLAARDPSQVPVSPKLPKTIQETYQALIASEAKFLDTLLVERAAIEPSFAQVRAARITTLDRIPLIVLAHGNEEFPIELNVSPDDWQQWEQTWLELQSELVAQSSSGKLVVAEQSGHYIQLDQPDLVIDAIQQVVATPR
jgi:pimeloyl-ACP methyl ester carboxylesterase